LAEIAGGRPFFSQVIETGSQPGNLDRIARGEADATADCVTYAFWRHYRPAAAERVRVLAHTPPSPAIPFVTSADTPAATVELLRAALHELALSPRYASVRAGLRISDIVDVPASAYRGLLDYEREASAVNYPFLA
jgi:ABC-type phosphate/phosphonate transport system substrate-binding protein